MKFYIILTVLYVNAFFIGCAKKISESKAYEISMYFSEAKQNKLSKLAKPSVFFSHKDYLFQFIYQDSVNMEFDLKTSVRKNTQVVNFLFVYVMPKESDNVFQINNFSKNYSVQKKINRTEMESGLKVKTEDEMAIAITKSFLKGNGKDTLINNMPLKYVDTTFTFNDTITIKDIMYFKKDAQFNSVYSFNKKSLLYNNAYTWYGIEAVINDRNYTGNIVENERPLTKEETEICEHIISTLPK